MSEKKFVDDDPSVYKDYVLYVVPNDANCDKLIHFLENSRPELYSMTWVQNARELKQKPAWLTGVPVFVCKEDKKAHKGSHAFKFVKDFKGEMSFAGSVSSSVFAFEEDEVLEKYQAMNSNSESVWDLGEAPPEDDFGLGGSDPKPRGQQPQQPAATSARSAKSQQAQTDAQSAAEAFMRARGSMDAQSQGRRGVGAAPMESRAEWSSQASAPASPPPPRRGDGGGGRVPGW